MNQQSFATPTSEHTGKRRTSNDESEEPVVKQKVRAVENQPFINLLRAKLEERKQQCQNLQAQLDDCEQQISAMVAEQSLEKRDQKTCKVLQKSNEELKDMLQKLKLSKAQANVASNKLKAERDRIIIKHNKLLAQHDKLSKEAWNLREQEPGGLSVRNLRAQKQNLESKVSMLEGLLEAKSAPEATLNAIIAHLEQYKGQDDGSIRWLQEQLQDLQANFRSFDGEKAQEQVGPQTHEDHSQLQTLKAEHEKLLTEKGNLETQLSNYAVQLQDLTDKLGQERDKLSSEHEVDLHLLATLKEDAAHLKSEHADLKKLLDTKSASEAAMNATIVRLEEAKSQDGDSIQQLQMQLQDLRAKLRTFEMEKVQKQAAPQTREDHSHFQTLKAENEKLLIEKGNLETQLQDLMDKLKQFQETEARLSNEHRDSLNILTMLKEGAVHLKLEHADLKKLLDTKSASEAAMNATIVRLKAAKSQDGDFIKQLQMQLQDMQVKLGDFEKEKAKELAESLTREDHSQSLYTLKAQHEKLLTEKENLETQLSDHAVQLGDLTVKLKQSQEEQTSLSNEIIIERKSREQLDGVCLKEIQHERSKLVASQVAYIALQRQHDHLGDLKTSLESRVFELKKQVPSNDIHGQYQDRIRNLEVALRASNLETPELQLQIRQLQAQLSGEKESRQKSSETKLQVKKYQVENRELNGRIFDLEMEKQELEIANRADQAERERVLQGLRKEIQDAKSATEKHMGASQIRVRDLEDEIRQLKTKAPNVPWVSQSRFDALNDSYERVKTSLFQAADHSEQEYISIAAQMRDLEQRLAYSNERSANLDFQLNKAMVEIERLRAEEQRLKKAQTIPTSAATPSGIPNPHFTPFPRPSPSIADPSLPAQSGPSSTPHFFAGPSTASSGQFCPTSTAGGGQSQPTHIFDVDEEDYSRTAGLDYLRRRGRKTLSAVNVKAALQSSREDFATRYPSYKLGPEIIPSSSQHPNTKKPWKKNKLSIYAHAGNSHSSNPQGPEMGGTQDLDPSQDNQPKGKRSSQSRKGKEQATGERPGSSLFSADDATDGDDEQESNTESESDGASDEEVESNDSETRRTYARQGILCDSWDNDETRRQISELGRLIIREALHVEQNNEAFARKGTSPRRLEKFRRNPVKYGPKLVNTRFDKIGSDTDDLLDSDWNQALIHNLSKLAAEIVANCQDPNRFGLNADKINWKKLIRERLYRIFLAVIKAQPLFEGETRAQICRRLEDEHERVNKRCAEVFSRHQKWKDRCDTSSVMLEACRQQGDTEGTKFWQYGLVVLEHLGHAGMSEDEDGIQTVRKNGRTKKKKIKIIRQLFYRHSSLTALFMKMDDTRAKEHTIFHQKGKPRKMRQRIAEFSYQDPPKGLSRSVLQDEYFDCLLPHQIVELELSNATIPLFNFDYDPASQP